MKADQSCDGRPPDPNGWEHDGVHCEVSREAVLNRARIYVALGKQYGCPYWIRPVDAFAISLLLLKTTEASTCIHGCTPAVAHCQEE
jgi:hypothetical protein